MTEKKFMDNLYSPAGVAASVIGLSLLLVSIIVATSFYKVKGLSDAVSVTGSAQKQITSDIVKWRSNFSRTVSVFELKTGSAQMKQDLEKVKGFLKDNGIDAKNITVNPVAVNPIYNNQGGGMYYGKGGFPGGGDISGYSFYQDILVESNEVEKITKVAQESSSLINLGVPLSSQSLEYYYSKLADVKVELLAEATKDAKLRAENIAKSANTHLGSLKSASMGVIQITPINSTDVSDYGYYDTTSIEKQITAVVRTSFTLR